FYSGESGVAQDLGSGWVKLDTYTPALLTNIGSTWSRNPYVGGPSENIEGGSMYAQRFLVSGQPLTIASVGAFIRVFGGPTDKLYWEIHDTGTDTLLPGASGVLTSSSAQVPAMTWYDDPIPTLIIPIGSYRFILKSPGSTGGNYYYWELLDPNNLSSPYIDLTYGGTAQYSETY